MGKGESSSTQKYLWEGKKYEFPGKYPFMHAKNVMVRVFFRRGCFCLARESDLQKNGGVESCSGSWRLAVCHEIWTSVPQLQMPVSNKEISAIGCVAVLRWLVAYSSTHVVCSGCVANRKAKAFWSDIGDYFDKDSVGKLVGW